MNERVSTLRRLASLLAEQASKMVPARQRQWAAAMRNELDYMETDRQALAWAAGCMRAAIMERLQFTHVPDSPAIRFLLAVPLTLLILNDLFATALTAVYRMGAFPIAREMGRMTPGDDYQRLIPLMENIPLWLHGLSTGAAALYAFTIVCLILKKSVSAVPVVAAVALEIAAQYWGRPVIEAIGVRADPNPSTVAVLVPLVLPFALALYLWRMRGPSYA